tara:strand:- start:264 stop:470 length:207 start_codon:yes stop_codon:yes gene_type:complete
MPGQNFINGPPNPRGVERTTLDGKIRIEDQSDFSILKITGLKFLVEDPKAPFVWFAIAMGVIFYVAGF